MTATAHTTTPPVGTLVFLPDLDRLGRIIAERNGEFVIRIGYRNCVRTADQFHNVHQASAGRAITCDECGRGDHGHETSCSMHPAT